MSKELDDLRAMPWPTEGLWCGPRSNAKCTMEIIDKLLAWPADKPLPFSLSHPIPGIARLFDDEAKHSPALDPLFGSIGRRLIKKR